LWWRNEFGVQRSYKSVLKSPPNVNYKRMIGLVRNLGPGRPDDLSKKMAQNEAQPSF
jgi:hypothetical protein